MRSVIDTKKEFNKVLIRAGVILGILVTTLVTAKISQIVKTRVESTPITVAPFNYKMLPMDRTIVGKFVVAQGFEASPDEIVGEGEESIYRWGKENETDRFLQISFKEGTVDYSIPKVATVKKTEDYKKQSPKVSELKVAERLAWDFVQKSALWDKRITLTPKIDLYSIDNSGVESLVTDFRNANFFKVYFLGSLPTKDKNTIFSAAYNGLSEKLPILSPRFETFIARVDIWGPTGEVISAKVYPIFLGANEQMRATNATITCEFRPETGFLPQGHLGYVARKGDFLTIWKAEEAGVAQSFRAL